MTEAADFSAFAPTAPLTPPTRVSPSESSALCMLALCSALGLVGACGGSTTNANGSGTDSGGHSSTGGALGSSGGAPSASGGSTTTTGSGGSATGGAVASGGTSVGSGGATGTGGMGTATGGIGTASGGRNGNAGAGGTSSSGSGGQGGATSSQGSGGSKPGTGGIGTGGAGSSTGTAGNTVPPGCTLPATVSFQKNVQPFLISSCGGSGCHVVDASSTTSAGGFNHGYDWMTAGSHKSSCPNGQMRFQIVIDVIKQANPATCSKSRIMPPAGAGKADLTACQIATLQAWLNEPLVTQMHRADDSSPTTPYPMPPFN